SYVVEALYTDRGAPGIDPLTGKFQVILQPKRKQAEFFSSMNGVQTQTTGDTQGGGLNLSGINDGDWVSYTPMNLRNITSVGYRAASAGLGGRIEVHVDSPTGAL